MGDSVKSLAEVEVDNSHCSPLLYPEKVEGCVSLANQTKRHVLISALLFALQIWSFAPRSPYCICNIQCAVLNLREFFFCLAS